MYHPWQKYSPRRTLSAPPLRLTFSVAKRRPDLARLLHETRAINRLYKLPDPMHPLIESHCRRSYKTPFVVPVEWKKRR